MAFIDETDLQKEIRAEELAQITRDDDTVIPFAIDAAVAEMKGYLSKFYNVTLIFSQTGTNRHALLVNFATDIAIYIIVSTALPGQDLEDRRARYKRAIDWLKGVAKGLIETDLPVIEVTDQVNKRGAVGEHNKRENYF